MESLGTGHLIERAVLKIALWELHSIIVTFQGIIIHNYIFQIFFKIFVWFWKYMPKNLWFPIPLLFVLTIILCISWFFEDTFYFIVVLGIFLMGYLRIYVFANNNTMCFTFVWFSVPNLNLLQYLYLLILNIIFGFA